MVHTKKKRLAAVLLGCSCCIVVLGIPCLVLGLKGYFSFKPPTISPITIHMEVFGFDVLDVGGSILDIVSGLSGGNPPSVAIKLATEVSNPNTYDITIEQKGEGTIAIPACIVKNETSSDGCANLENMIIPPDSPDDFMLGNWELPVTILEANSTTTIAVSLSNAINLQNLSGDQYNFLYDLYTSGGPLLLRVRGGAKASSWLPMSGSATFNCLAEWDFDKLTEIASKMPLVKCNFDVMNMIL
jgi:hypothetical protein